MKANIQRIIKDDVSLAICGEAGQGIQTVERLFTRVLKLAGFDVFAVKEYMSRIRGGSNSIEIRVSSSRARSFLGRIDILIPLDKNAIPHLERRITKDTIILGDKEKIGNDERIIDIPFSKIAAEVGGMIYANTVGVALLLGLFNVELETLTGHLQSFFKTKSQDIIDKNIQAAHRGYELGRGLAGPGKIEIQMQRHSAINDEVIFSGADSISLGAIAGGCNFIAAYPMTPSTGIITFLSPHAREFGIVVEQPEDEIAGINMALGASYAGARAMVATAGGGFALMIEALSLAGMIETPIVISVGQRPAPATGLPTRTEQGDLQHVLYSGHGEFPRIVLAPGSIEEAFYLTQKAFNLADRFQSPVIILSDQYLVDSYYNMPPFDLSALKVEKSFVKTGKEYKRFQITDSGVSPRGIPGHGEGMVMVDSDEHDEEGRITEDFDVRTAMVDKRLRKMRSIEKEIVPPELVGSERYKTLVVGWGSTYHTIKEALGMIGRDDIAFLHFKQIYPLHPLTAEYLKKAETRVILENNATAQFGKLVKLHTGMEWDHTILKYNGLPFTVEETIERLKEIASKKPAFARA